MPSPTPSSIRGSIIMTNGRPVPEEDLNANLKSNSLWDFSSHYDHLDQQQQQQYHQGHDPANGHMADMFRSTPIDVHLPEDDELMSYLEEFSPCADGECPLPPRTAPQRQPPRQPIYQQHMAPPRHSYDQVVPGAGMAPIPMGRHSADQPRHHPQQPPQQHHYTSQSHPQQTQPAPAPAWSYIGSFRGAFGRERRPSVDSSMLGSRSASAAPALQPPARTGSSRWGAADAQQAQQQAGLGPRVQTISSPAYNPSNISISPRVVPGSAQPSGGYPDLAPPGGSPMMRSGSHHGKLQTTRFAPQQHPPRPESPSTLHEPHYALDGHHHHPHHHDPQASGYYAPRNGGAASLDLDRTSVWSAVTPESDSGYSEEDGGDSQSGANHDALLALYGANSLTFTESERPTLFELLRPYTPSLEQANSEYKAFQTLSAWLMGSAEASVTHYAHWKPAVRALQFAIPRMLNVPKIDLGANQVSVKLRRAILLVSSMQYRCHYCAAHMAGVGDILSGSYRAKVRRAKHSALQKQAKDAKWAAAANGSQPGFQDSASASSTASTVVNSPVVVGSASLSLDMGSFPSPGGGPAAAPAAAAAAAGEPPVTNVPAQFRPVMDPSDPRNSQKEADALRLVTAASRIPSKVTPELKRNVLNSFGLDGLQTIGCIAAMIGWTNAITDSVGMQLGVSDILFAQEQIGPSGWSGDRHATDSYKETGRFSVSELEQAKEAEFVPQKGLKRLVDYTTVLKNLHAAEKECVKWATPIPTTHRGIDDFVFKHFGFLPKYLQHMQNLESKRAVTFMLWHFLLRSKEEQDPCVEGEACEWSNGAKALMFYVYTTATGNLLLRGHAAFLAVRRKVPVHILVSAAAGVPVNNARLDACLDFIRSAASLKRVFTARNNRRLLENMLTPRGVMEAVSSLGLFNMLHRLSAIIAPEPVQFEPQIKDFLVTFGQVLDLDPNDAAPQSREERKVQDPLQFLF
ncbi:hypothetical protein HDU96_002741 [Phlyctochytrium bullatum]|nr:hypothetical protein HDU96_002741 [Phlyctochytrium bullatum]